jgi:hypothetical protein
MATSTEIEAVVQRLKSADLPLTELASLLQYRSPIVRANALDAIAVRTRGTDSLTGEVLAAAADPANAVPLMGTISVAHVAVACLLRIGSPKADQSAKALLETWPEPDKTDLMWYLKSEGLLKKV